MGTPSQWYILFLKLILRCIHECLSYECPQRNVIILTQNIESKLDQLCLIVMISAAAAMIIFTHCLRCTLSNEFQYHLQFQYKNSFQIVVFLHVLKATLRQCQRHTNFIVSKLFFFAKSTLIC